MSDAEHFLITQNREIDLTSGKEYAAQGNDYRFLYITGGIVEAIRGNTSGIYSAGDLFLLIPKTSCRLIAKEDSSFLLLGIDSGFISNHVNGRWLLYCDSTMDSEKDYLAIKNLLLSISENCRSQSQNASLSVQGYLYLLLAELRGYQTLASADAELPKKHKDRISEIESYIEQHCDEPLTLSSIAKAFYLTPQYFSSFMKNTFHVNFKTYLTERRLAYAARDLRNTNLSILEVSLKNGFGSVSVFRKNFTSHYDLSPLAYRKQFRHNAETAAEKDSRALLTDNLPTDSSAHALSENPAVKEKSGEKTPGILQETKADSAGSGTLFRNVSTAINIGSAQNLLSHHFREQLLTFQETMSFTHIRIQEFISNSFIPMLLPNYNYYFQNVDNALGFLFDHGLTPWIELALLPISHESGRDGNAFFYIHRNKRYWMLLEHFLAHIAGHWPASWTQNWLFEIWMSPNESVDAYIADFRTIRKLLNTYLPGASLGGPGYNSYTSKHSLDDILHGFQTSGFEPDFFSVYLHYNISTCSSDTAAHPFNRISSDPDWLEISLSETSSKLRNVLPNAPLFVSEWSSVDITDLPVAYSRYQAAFIIRTLLHISPFCSKAAYWLFSDAPLTKGILNPPSFFYFGHGLLDRNGAATAAYYAYCIYHELSGEIISKGDNFCVTRVNSTHYQAIAFHYSHFAPLGERTKKDSYAFDQIYSLFRQEPDYRFHISLNGLENGIYRIASCVISREYGSNLDTMIGEFRHSNLDRIAFLSKTKLPYKNNFTLHSKSEYPRDWQVFLKSDGFLTLEATLCPHDVFFWDIRKQV